MAVSFLFLGVAAIGILLAITGLILLIASKDKANRIVGGVLLSLGCLFTAASVGTFVLMVNRMG